MSQLILNCDKFFIQELQKEGYDIDYKRITQIYKNSRQNEGYKKRKQKKMREQEEMEKFAEKFYR